jgi:hypothetical protein
MSYATIFIPGSGVMASFGDNTDEFNQAFGLYLMTWFVITVLFMCVLPVNQKQKEPMLSYAKFLIASLLLGRTFRS